MTTVKKNLKRLTNLKDDYVWYDCSSGYGSSAEAYLLTEEGIRGGMSITDSPISINQEEYDKAQKILASGAVIEDDYDGEVEYKVLKMVEAGCVPGVKYYDDPYDTDYEYFEEYDDAVCEGLTNTELTPWSDMDEEELEGWCRVLDYIEKGYNSWYDLPEPSEDV